MTFDERTLTWMRAAQTTHMQDECYLVRFVETGAIDAWGQPIMTNTETYSQCGLKLRRSWSGMGDAQVEMIDGELRLPSNTELSQIDHVRVIRRYGEDPAQELTFELAGEPKAGPTGILVDVRYRGRTGAV